MELDGAENIEATIDTLVPGVGLIVVELRAGGGGGMDDVTITDERLDGFN